MTELKKNYFFNEEVNIHLENIIKNKSFANGYIFYGAEGIGKKLAALKFIKEIFSQYSSNSNIESRITNKNHPDLLIIEPKAAILEAKSSKISDPEKTKKSSTEIIKINQIRNIKTFLSQKSIDSEKKIILIIDAHLLNEAASNCLLKILEEPNNGIFILLTTKLNLLLDTVISRCQIIRFRSLSANQIEGIINDNLDFTKKEIFKKLKFQDLINCANGSPGQLYKNVEIWNEFSDKIFIKLDSILKNNLEIFGISKVIAEQFDMNQQIHLINLIQIMWWRKTKNISLVKNLEVLKSRIKKNIQPRLSWEVTFLKIYLEDMRI
tara:strand:+ start:2301 stop:3269 length:969 start_codon:yes stop_codon:yes gene_type:complete